MTQKTDWVLSRYQGFLVPLMLSFLFGNVVAYVADGEGFPCFSLWGGLSLGVFALGLLLYSRARWAWLASAVLMAFLLGGLYFQGASFHPPPSDVSRWGYRSGATVQGILQPKEIGQTQRVLAVQTVNGQATTGQVVLQGWNRLGERETLPRVGTTLLLTGNLKPPTPAAFPGAFDQRRYLWDQRITMTMSGIRQMQVLNPKPVTLQGHLFRWVADLRDRITTVFTNSLPSPESEVLGGVVLGSRAVPLDRTVRSQFAHTGLVHLLAASGLHVGIVAGLILWGGGRFIPNRRLRFLVAMGVVGIYALLTGLPPSVQRAGLMMELALALKLLDRNLSSLTLLSVAALALVLGDPNILGSVGFQLSVLSTFGLITMVPPLQNWLSGYVGRWVSGAVLVPLVAQLWIQPFTTFYFNHLPLHSVPFNVLALVLVPPLTAIGFTAGVVSFLWPQLAGWIAMLAFPFLKAMLWLVAWGDGMTWAQRNLPSPEPWNVFLWYGVLLVGVVCLTTLSKRSRLFRWNVWLSVLLVGMGVMVWQRWEHAQHATVEVVPLSYRSLAVAVRPARQQGIWILVPEVLNHWEGRALLDYVRHRGQDQLQGLVLWPEPGKRPRKLFLFQDGLEEAQIKALPLVPLPPSGRLFLGDLGLALEENQGIRVTAPGFCLQGVRTLEALKEATCPMAFLQSGEGPHQWRFQKAIRSLESGRFYRFDLFSQVVRVYSLTRPEG
jgi:ComEC/Rec2-related protein